MNIIEKHFLISKKRGEDQSLALAMEQLDVWYYIQKLQGANELLNRQRILQSHAGSYGMEALREGQDFVPVQKWKSRLQKLKADLQTATQTAQLSWLQEAVIQLENV